MGEVNAIFWVERLSPNGVFMQVVKVWARTAEEARAVAEEDGWTALSCGPPDFYSPPDYGKARIISQAR